jgi:hypothetical protein
MCYFNGMVIVLKEFILLVFEKALKFNGLFLNLFPGMASAAAAFWVCGRNLEKRRKTSSNTTAIQGDKIL